MYKAKLWDGRGMHSLCFGVQQFELQRYPMTSEGFALKRGERLLMLSKQGDDCCWAMGVDPYAKGVP